jgi:hypothetical protein
MEFLIRVSAFRVRPGSFPVSDISPFSSHLENAGSFIAGICNGNIGSPCLTSLDRFKGQAFKAFCFGRKQSSCKAWFDIY